MTDSESEGFLVASGSPFRFTLGRVVVPLLVEFVVLEVSC
jgi:hypothetical protein